MRALYGLKSSGEAWIDKLAETINSIGYRSTESDPDVLINRETTENVTDYYKYMLAYVNDVIHLANDAQEYMLNLNQVYQFKEGFGPPYKYLGANFDKIQLEDGRTIRSMTCIEYLRGAIKNVNSILEGNKAALKSFGDIHCTYPSSYRT